MACGGKSGVTGMEKGATYPLSFEASGCRLCRPFRIIPLSFFPSLQTDVLMRLVP